MEMTSTTRDRDLTISLAGELDHHGAQGAIRFIDSRIEQNLPTRTIIDLGGMTFMDSSGIAVVIRAKRRMELLGGTVRVIRIPRQAARVFETAGLSNYVELSYGGEK